MFVLFYFLWRYINIKQHPVLGHFRLHFINILIFQIFSRQLHILTNRTTALGVYSVLNGRHIADWSVDNMRPDEGKIM
jgi:hypothetical protein